MNNKNNFYYSITDIMGYNALFNYIIGERGVGKTFSAKEYVINKHKNSLNYKAHFICHCRFYAYF